MRRSLHCQCQFIRSRIIGSRWTDLCEIAYLPDLCEITYLPDKCEIFACKHKVYTKWSYLQTRGRLSESSLKNLHHWQGRWRL